MDLILGSLLVTTILVYTRVVLPWNEKRTDLVELNDTLIQKFPTINTSLPVTLIEQIGHVYYWLHILYWKTVDTDVTMVAWMILLFTRTVMIYVCPLKAPYNAIPLYDVIQRLLLVDIEPFMNDLFFSGHVSACVMRGLTMTENSWVFYYSAFIIGVLMMFSKIHYTIDMLVAPYVAYGSYHMARFLLR